MQKLPNPIQTIQSLFATNYQVYGTEQLLLNFLQNVCYGVRLINIVY